MAGMSVLKKFKGRLYMGDYALCPFYEYEKNGILHCECRNIEFPSSVDRKVWLKMHCNSWKYKICSIYNEQLKKYE